MKVGGVAVKYCDDHYRSPCQDDLVAVVDTLQCCCSARRFLRG